MNQGSHNKQQSNKHHSQHSKPQSSQSGKPHSSSGGAQHSDARRPDGKPGRKPFRSHRPHHAGPRPAQHAGHAPVHHAAKQVHIPSGPFTPFPEDVVFSKLIEPLQRALQHEGYTTPTPIQAQAIAPLLEGKDLFGVAQTGTGKTAAFLLPLLQYLTKEKRMPSRGRPRSLILAPTRELAAQIGDSIDAYGRYLHITHTVIFGGVGQRPQEDALARGMDIVVATPGRLLDLMQQGFVRLDGIEVFILDEADRMLDMGFIHDIRKIIEKLPAKRHSLFFSATMEAQVVTLARTLVHDPVHITIEPEKPTVDRIAQVVMFVDKKDKDTLLVKTVRGLQRVIIFTQMKHMANRVADKLTAAGITAAAIHGNKSQTARMQALAGFKAGKVAALVATDIAARGIDVENITHVINYDLPNEPETYVHRIGRTARAGSSGDAISFCTAEDRQYLRDIERLIRKKIPVDERHSLHSEAAKNSTAPPPPRQQPRFARNVRHPRGPRR